MYGAMERYFRGSGEMAKKMVLEFGSPLREIHTRVCGPITDKMEKDCIYIMEVRNIGESSKIF